jgi:hypothetical protein
MISDVIGIITPLPVDEALICLDRFDNDWFLGHVHWLGHFFIIFK